MHTPHAPQRQETETEKANGKKSSPMQQLSQEEIAHHTRPAPRAQPPEIDPFPPGIWIGLWRGIAGGALLGLIIGNLLFQGVIQIEGIEGLFSMTPFTFHAFWVFAGAAAGLFVGGLIGIVTAPPPMKRE